jgi:hypothetical protein
MRYFVSAALILFCLFLVTGVTRVALLPIGQAWGAEAQVASLQEDDAASKTDKSRMTPWSRTAQVRCPSGQLVFLTTECGCRGACCNCAANARYLNHCTCQCSPNPPPAAACIKGFSVGRN